VVTDFDRRRPASRQFDREQCLEGAGIVGKKDIRIKSTQRQHTFIIRSTSYEYPSKRPGASAVMGARVQPSTLIIAAAVKRVMKRLH